MPEYLAPGVYIEEVSFRSKSIEGVSTTTTGFIGPTRYGPLTMEPDLITSLGEFERVYGDRQQIEFSDTGKLHNYMWHAARAFFEEGGKRLYVSRVFRSGIGNGYATWSQGSETSGIRVSARFPGEAGNVHVRVTLRRSQNILSGRPVAGSSTLEPMVSAISNYDVVVMDDVISPISPSISEKFYLAVSRFDSTTKKQTWRFTDESSPLNVQELALLNAAPNADDGDQVHVVTLSVSVTLDDGTTMVWTDLAPDPRHKRNGADDSLTSVFGERPSNLSQARTMPFMITGGTGLLTGLDVLNALFGSELGVTSPLESGNIYEIEFDLTGGNDGVRPTAAEYEGEADPDKTEKTGLKQFEDIEDISIVAAPGSTFSYENGYRSNGNTIISHLIAHAQKMRYRIAVLDCGEGQSLTAVRAMRARFDSTYAALYYPWVRVLDPVTQAEILLPPSGFIAGIYARNDIQRAVYKAPANEIVTLALSFERLLNKEQQDVLNPEGINALRFFEGRGFRVWGARTISSDPEWKYVNLRRYFAYLERSVDRGTQWAVFEPNGEALWANVRTTIEDFLFNEWTNGALLGEKPDKAYFVRCDRSTMTQNDLDNGRLICLVGVAPLRPAEFVIFRIGQWTADRKR